MATKKPSDAKVPAAAEAKEKKPAKKKPVKRARPLVYGPPTGEECKSVLGDSATIFGARYAITMEFRERVVGGIPKDPEVQLKWLKRKGIPKREAEEMVRARRAEIPDGEQFAQEEQEKTWSGFREDETGLYIEARQIRAMLRESATELTLTADSTQGMRQRLQHGVVMKPKRIYLRRDGKAIKEPDGNDMAVVHATTPKGPIAAFSRFDFLEGVEIEFEIWIVQEHKFNEEKLRAMLLLAQETGFGCRRSQGEGQFDVTEFNVVYQRSAPREQAPE